jgi:hypothetical protein
METSTHTWPKAKDRPRSLIFDWIVCGLALAGTGFCIVAIVAGVVALRAPDADGMEGIAVIFGAGYLVFFAPALGLTALGIRTRRFEYTLVATILMFFAVVGAPTMLVLGVFS